MDLDTLQAQAPIFGTANFSFNYVTENYQAVSASIFMQFREKCLNEFCLLKTDLDRIDVNYIILHLNILNSLNH